MLSIVQPVCCPAQSVTKIDSFSIIGLCFERSITQKVTSKQSVMKSNKLIILCRLVTLSRHPESRNIA